MTERARQCPTCGFAVGTSKRYCARCGTAVPADAPEFELVAVGAPSTAAGQPAASTGRAAPPADAWQGRVMRTDMHRPSDHDVARCAECGGRPALGVHIQRPRHQTAFLLTIVAAAAAFAVLHRVHRDPAMYVGWVFITAGAFVVALPALPWWRSRPVRSTLCRTCTTARAVTQIDRAARSAALLPISLLWNAASVARNVEALRTVRSLAPPTERRRLRGAGRPIYARVGVYAFVVSSLAWIGLARTDAMYAAARTIGFERPAAWHVGGCVSSDLTGDHAVSCNLAHDGRIVDVVLHSDDCPVGTDRWMSHDGRFACVDDDG